MKFNQLGLKFDERLSNAPCMAVRLIEDIYPDVAEYGTVSSFFGEMTLVWSEYGLLYLGFEEERSLEKLCGFFPDISLHKNLKGARVMASRVKDVWEGSANEPLGVIVSGTVFQKEVWRALLKIPFGHVVSYGAIASFLGREKAVRAVGSAVGANPISLLIPCHRVIQKNGSVCNYGWGDAVKQKLLKMEAEAVA